MRNMLSLIAAARTQTEINAQKALNALRHRWVQRLNLTADQLDALFQDYQTIKYTCICFIYRFHARKCVTVPRVKVRHILIRALSGQINLYLFVKHPFSSSNISSLSLIVGMSLPSWSRSTMMSWPIIERPRLSIMSCICTQRFLLGPASRGSRGGIGSRGRICLSRWRNQ